MTLAALIVEDENNSWVKSDYDAITEQHVISVKLSQQITLNFLALSDN